MLRFHKFFSLSLIIVFCGESIYSLDPSDSSPLYSHDFLEIRHETEILGGENHKIAKRNAFETLRELSLGSDSGSDTDKLIVNRRIYNSSVALTIPFYSFKIPHLLDGGFAVNEAIFGIFAWGITGLVFGLSFIFTGSVPTDEQSRSFRRLSDQAKTSHFNFLGSDFSKSFGMDGMQCIQKVICQAHSPKEGRRYGIMSTTIQNLFPAPENDTSLIESTSVFGSAARAGKYSGKICDNLFDCILDPLGSARYLVHWYSHKYENARFLLKLVDYADEPSSLDTVGTNSTTIYSNESVENL